MNAMSNASIIQRDRTTEYECGYCGRIFGDYDLSARCLDEHMQHFYATVDLNLHIGDWVVYTEDLGEWHVKQVAGMVIKLKWTGWDQCAFVEEQDKDGECRWLNVYYRDHPTATHVRALRKIDESDRKNFRWDMRIWSKDQRRKWTPDQQVQL